MSIKHDITLLAVSAVLVVSTAAFAISSRERSSGLPEIEVREIQTTAAPEKVSETFHNTSDEPEEPLYIDINTAGTDELQMLKGIGPALAEEIIRYRGEHGGFSDITEIMEVSGIGESVFKDICGRIYVSPVVTESATEPATEPETETQPIAQPETEPYKPSLEDVAPININTAGIEDLTLLPYVDEEIAASIIELRELINGYSHVYELLYIEELEQKQVAEIIEFVTVGQ